MHRDDQLRIDSAWDGPSLESEFARFLGLWWEAPGELALTISANLINDVGLLLGPVGFAMADYAMGAALRPSLNAGERVATLNLAVSFHNGADSGVARCRAHLDRRGRHHALLSSTMIHEDGRLLSSAMGTFSIFRLR